MSIGECMNNIVGIKLADGTFYPILEEGEASSKLLELTTVRDDQETVQLDLYKAIAGDESNLEYVDTLLIENLLPRAKEEPTLSLTLNLDEDDVLSASIEEAESGESSSLKVSLLNSSEPTQIGSPDFSLANTDAQINLSSAAYMDDVPRESDIKEDFDLNEIIDENENLELNEVIDENEDFELSEVIDENENFELNEVIDENKDLDETEFEIDVPLMEDSFPDFSDDLDVTSSETGTLSSEEMDSFSDSLYDFGDSVDELEDTPSLDEEAFSTEGLDDSMPAPEFSFSDLYDNKDYKEEEELEIKEEKGNKKTGFIILLLILILLLLGGILFLFWDTLGFGSKEKAPKIETELFEENRFAAEPTVEAVIPEDKTGSAKENEIVKLETEVVVPEPVKETPVEVEVISYKIKWGDTLWDISNAYYKTPWLYPKIADYNGIKNPDYIISGRWIQIPPK